LAHLDNTPSAAAACGAPSPPLPCLLALEGTGFGADDRIANCVIGVSARHPLVATVLREIVTGYDGVQHLLGSPKHPFHRQYKIYYRLAGGPPQLTHCFTMLGMEKAMLIGPKVFSPVPWWRGQSKDVPIEKVQEQFPESISTHYGFSTNNPIVVDAESVND
jgi:hypothetical protein